MSRESMIEGHWLYSKGLLEAAGVGGQALAIAEYLYKQVWVHSAKHLMEELQEKGLLKEEAK